MHLIDRSMDEDDAEILESVLTDMYVDAESVPPVVLIAEEESATALTREYLVELRGHPVEIAAPSAASDAARSNWRATTPCR